MNAVLYAILAINAAAPPTFSEKVAIVIARAREVAETPGEKADVKALDFLLRSYDLGDKTAKRRMIPYLRRTLAVAKDAKRRLAAREDAATERRHREDLRQREKHHRELVGPLGGKPSLR